MEKALPWLIAGGALVGLFLFMRPPDAGGGGGLGPSGPPSPPPAVVVNQAGPGTNSSDVGVAGLNALGQLGSAFAGTLGSYFQRPPSAKQPEAGAAAKV